ncbi:acyloxyacyl hydrolase [Celeribacter arenosi]|uniref:Lipid A 3-O-deacylase (PagL) n=1 Tax=Celeribacter arenosi TaxID=792649 RepID=A0ABP7K8A5_9RHOB
MDGGLAAAFLVAGLLDMGVNYCGEPEGCFAQGDAPARFGVAFGNVIFDGNGIGSEIYLRYDAPGTFGPFQPVFGVSLTDDASAWVGAGAAWDEQFGNGYVELHLMAGLYANGNGVNLGSPLEFRSGVEVGYEFDNGWRVGAYFDHRSNADIEPVNPGLETLQLRVSVPIN